MKKICIFQILTGLVFFAIVAFLGYSSHRISMYIQNQMDETSNVKMEWLDIQKKRKYILREICSKYNMSASTFEKTLSSQLFVEHRYKFIYCEVPKVGCTNWKRIMLQLTMNLTREPGDFERETVHASSLLKKLSIYSLEKQQSLLQNYTKIMFTRNPEERLVSAYRDKFLHDGYYSNIIGSYIRHKYRKKDNDTSNVTFEEFIKFVLGENTSDTHWKPMFMLCHPCSIHYDFIGEFSSLKKEADYILRYLGVPETVTYPNFKTHSNESRTFIKITEAFMSNITIKEKDEIHQKYEIDFLMFNYTFH
ncbi:carbohydrate sulfotransferase 9-like [Protopterus annectens]|uniref:carbohydrate sulfotransferase 9-like n=1 Tax=Protopterus annectens TaxID=7888 RepID=UPI001CF9D143|nr:carbohydrate sulfotransferase 9-like [Protopterus annectens]XP_043942023.1 carbohydrate sulfotransferase 9-like [Protopterus annectens]XP_043942024.1 carbohydrate sulfotransferase 9-like [Protopterus annectens]